MTYQSQLTELKGMIEKIDITNIPQMRLFYWDKITYMPESS